MNIKEISTTDLVKELCRRAEHFDALASLAASVHEAKVTKALTPPSLTVAVKELPKRRHLLRAQMVFDVIKSAGRPLRSDEIHKRLGKGTSQAVSSQLGGLIEKKRIVRLGNERPFAYQVVTGSQND
jgi:hypothetical protein